MSAWLKPPKKELILPYCPSLPVALLSLYHVRRQGWIFF